MAIGDLISATDYNSIRDKVIALIGTGKKPDLTYFYDASHGYGQTTFSSEVVAGNQVTKAQWDALRYDLYNTLLHQTGVTPSIIQVALGSVIAYGAANPNTQYSTLADTAKTTRFNLGSGQFVTDALASASTSSSWYQSRSTTATVTFGTAEQARFFFNSGGKIRFSSSRTGGSSGVQQNTAWSNLLASAGTQGFGASTSGVNFYNLTSSYQEFYSLSASSPYSANNWKLEAQSNVANNSNGTATVLTFRITWTDGYFDPGPEPSPAPGDLVDGTLSLSVDAVRAYGVLQPTGTAGSFAIVGPTTTVIDPFTGS
jgi:hypothetical protein